MNSFFSFSEITNQASELYKLAKEMPGKDMDVQSLDKPICRDVADVTKDKAIDRAVLSDKLELTDNQRKLIMKETDWSPEIVDCIKSMDQYEIYKDASLMKAEVAGRNCLVKKIDHSYVDPKTGFTNQELMEKGRSPIDAKTGERIELHHMGQDFYSPFAELCENSEHGDGNDVILHDKTIDSWRQDPELKRQYNNIQRPEHWRARAMEV